MSREIDELNRASLERLRTVTRGLSDEDLARLIDPHWSPAALCAHMAFWDRFAHARWVHAARVDSEVPVSMDDEMLEMVNEAAMGQWAVVPPGAAVDQCLEAAEAANRFIESLHDAVLARCVNEGRERLVDRSIHRLEHLRTIEGAFRTG
jgi:hypothetical protein